MIVEPEEETKSKEKQTNKKKITLHNDDHNSFDHVELSLVNVCGHTHIQAAQCALIVHNKGKCIIKEGDEDTLKRMCVVLKELALTVTMN
jgi:ATP-dependent Clp protease adaptor protein ClpS